MACEADSCNLLGIVGPDYSHQPIFFLQTFFGACSKVSAIFRLF
ncbi:hypothetical protein RNAN_0232 [Rheinheimera nanhaiensis E407-8]|uniref:Uncharacterized protein n=1 Tax=Rheinheimera nanhaiensis E407-8 TaxID=562729 RepID=I1DT91_9GAMM|nr:hypothetical protein RNAN_0232 [Rheinheimera nanhaiensis E407-8]